MNEAEGDHRGEIMGCFVCPSDKHIEDHHYDCRGGAINQETIPLCKRCHRTYHDLGVEWFDDDLLERAIEVENRRREILNCQLHCVNPFPLLTREDIKRSDFWNKTHGITTKKRVKRKEQGFESPQLTLF